MAAKPLHDVYISEIRDKLKKDLGLTNIHEIPKLEKVVLNRGISDLAVNPKSLEVSVEELTVISGQKPLITRARKSIATFKIRARDAIGAKVTLRGKRMYQFVDKLIHIALPKIRDFRGVSPKSFDGRGNYTLGLTEQLIFPEIDYDKIDKLRGMDITFVTSAKTDAHARALLEALGMPFRKQGA